MKLSDEALLFQTKCQIPDSIMAQNPHFAKMIEELADRRATKYSNSQKKPEQYRHFYANKILCNLVQEVIETEEHEVILLSLL